MLPKVMSLACLWVTLQCLSLPMLEATSLAKVSHDEGVSIDTEKAHNFLARSRLRREADPNWHHQNPDFQSYYRYYSSIGHTEGLYEIDRLRMLYQQMRHLELTYGPDASEYQNSLGLQQKTTSAPTTQPPPPTLPPHSKVDVIYLCNANDPQCKPRLVYLPTGAVPVLCDPRYNPNCKLSRVQENSLPVQASESVESPIQNLPKSTLLPPPQILLKEMEYDCDPYWDPDCLIDHPPRPVKMSQDLPTDATSEHKIETGNNVPTYDPYDFSRDLYDPYRYAPAPGP